MDMFDNAMEKLPKECWKHHFRPSSYEPHTGKTVLWCWETCFHWCGFTWQGAQKNALQVQPASPPARKQKHSICIMTSYCTLASSVCNTLLNRNETGWMLDLKPRTIGHYIWDPHSESLSCSPGHFSNFQVEVFRVQKSYHFGREKHVVCWSHVVRLLRVSGANLGLSLGFFASKNHAISVVKKHSVSPMLYKFTGFPAPTLGGLQLRNRFEPVVTFFGCRSSLPPSWIRLVSGFPGLHFGLCGFHIGSILGSRVQFCTHFGFQSHKSLRLTCGGSVFLKQTGSKMDMFDNAMEKLPKECWKHHFRPSSYEPHTGKTVLWCWETCFHWCGFTWQGAQKNALQVQPASPPARKQKHSICIMTSYCTLASSVCNTLLNRNETGWMLDLKPRTIGHYIWDPHSESLSCSPGHFSNFQVEVFRVQKSYHFGREKHVVCWSHVVRLLRVSGANLGLSLGFFASKNHAISVVKKHSVVGPMLYKFTGFPAPTLGGLQLRNRFEPVVAFFGCRSSLPPSWIRLVSGFPGLHFGLCGFHIGSILGSRVQFCIHFGFQSHKSLRLTCGGSVFLKQTGSKMDMFDNAMEKLPKECWKHHFRPSSYEPHTGKTVLWCWETCFHWCGLTWQGARVRYFGVSFLRGHKNCRLSPRFITTRH